MRILLVSLAGAAAAISTPASAAWQVAQSKHFIIYADESPRELQDFATKLERFDQAVRYAVHLEDPVIGDGNRLTVFVLPAPKDVRAIIGDKTGFIAGFYSGRVAGPLAYVPQQTGNSVDDQTVFFHEYTHHLMQQALDRPYPQWYSEGFAEFFSTPKFDRDGSVWLGRVAQHRAYGILDGPQLPMETLLQGTRPGMSNEQRDVFYGRGWLLTHYLLMDPRRQGQLSAYVDALASGAPPLDGARKVFGDLSQLDRELNAYRTKPLLQFQIPAAKIRIGPINITPLSPGASQVMMTRARIKYGLAPDAAKVVAAQMRGVESRYPGDDMVESTLAEVELEAGHAEAAEAAADRAMKANPQSTEALILKGRALVERADKATGSARTALFDQARETFVAANKIDTEDPEPLYRFFRTYLRQGIRPTENAVAALHYASDLAPQDLGVRMNSAIAYLHDGKPKEARATLTVAAYSPHASEMTEIARRMIADIDAGDAKAALLEARRAPTQPASN